jgi:predicted acetyltransferase
MPEIKLIKPTIEYKNEYLDMVAEWRATGEPFTPFSLAEDPSDFEAMLTRLAGYTRGVGVREGFVPNSTFWLVRDDRKVLGAVNVRHYLNDRLKFSGGHIGYGVRPSERRNGYAKEMLRQALIIARGTGIRKVLLMCDKDNISSARTIMANGGVLDSEDVDKEGTAFQRYWISIY